MYLLNTVMGIYICIDLLDLTLFLLWLCALQAEDEDVILRSIEGITVGLYVVKHNSTMRPEDRWDQRTDETRGQIVLEGQQVLTDVDNITLAATMLFGLMYGMNLNYPPKLKCIFKVLQQMLMELDGNMLSKKAQAFKNKLFERAVATDRCALLQHLYWTFIDTTVLHFLCSCFLLYWFACFRNVCFQNVPLVMCFRMY